MFSTDTDQRVNALSKAMSWYDQCIAYLAFKQEGKLTTNQLKEKSKGEESRLAGIKAPQPHNKEIRFTEAIKHFEKMATVYSPPGISRYLRVFNKKRKVLESRKVRLNDKFGKFLDLLGRAVNPKNSAGKHVKLQVDKINTEYRIDAEGNITFDRKLVLHLRKLLRKYGLLTPVLKCIPILTESAALTPELDPHGHKTGRTVISSRKRYNSFLEMMYHLNRFMMTDSAPRRLVRKPRTQRTKTKEVK